MPSSVETIFIPDRTRRRANFAAMVIQGKPIIGFHERKSKTIRNVPDCLLLNDDLRAAMEAVRPYLPRLMEEGKKLDLLIQCVGGQTEIGITGHLVETLAVQEALADVMRDLNLARISRRDRDYESYETVLEARPFLKRFGDLTVPLAPGAFLQPSTEGEEALTRCVLAHIRSERTVADLFCGNGTFTGPLMEGRDIYAADFAADAIANLRRAGVDAHMRNLFKEPLSVQDLAKFEAVILDPPRAGAAAQAAALADSAVPKIVYVSCNPQTFAKDARTLATGGYGLDALSVVDQFIWSAHTEVVGLFTRHS